ncbi:CBS domain-containing protein [Streptomyces albidus (ex Kaewkla and Franco 2022)]|uniref:CBS domain-containing protein n=1 Tax=Streptomyces albidus (ex Kaewkla and Franco 2022) TaxID=722709 RepID=UPI0015EEC87F|nr:CBS domain-containing protein [Streptomyces albidus (ex Kaewkla and Franco 2022)]
MRYREVGDLMVTPGIRVHRGTALEEVAATLSQHHVSAVPVVDQDECPVGVVSAGDLRRSERHLPDSRNALSPSRPHPGPAGNVMRDAPTAGEVMTSPAVTARPGWTVVEAVRVMERRRVKRLPVVDEADQLVGFVSRADLLRVFVRADGAVREEIVSEILDRTLGLGPSQVRVTVKDGRVMLQGIVDHPGLLPIVERLVEGVPGVIEVRDYLAHRRPTPVDGRPAPL